MRGRVRAGGHPVGRGRHGPPQIGLFVISGDAGDAGITLGEFGEVSDGVGGDVVVVQLVGCGAERIPRADHRGGGQVGGGQVGAGSGRAVYVRVTVPAAS